MSYSFGTTMGELSYVNLIQSPDTDEVTALIYAAPGIISLYFSSLDKARAMFPQAKVIGK